MTLQEALDKCSCCDLFNKNISDEHKFQAIDKIMSTPSTKVPKVKLCNITTWLLKKVKWQQQQIEKMKACSNCRYFAELDKLCYFSLGDEDYYCRGRKWEIKP